MTDFKINDKVKITEHTSAKYIGRTGILLNAQRPPHAISGKALNYIVCKVKLDETGEIVDCILSQLTKV